MTGSRGFILRWAAGGSGLQLWTVTRASQRSSGFSSIVLEINRVTDLLSRRLWGGEDEHQMSCYSRFPLFSCPPPLSISLWATHYTGPPLPWCRRIVRRWRRPPLLYLFWFLTLHSQPESSQGLWGLTPVKEHKVTFGFLFGTEGWAEPRVCTRLNRQPGLALKPALKPLLYGRMIFFFLVTGWVSWAFDFKYIFHVQS